MLKPTGGTDAGRGMGEASHVARTGGAARETNRPGGASISHGAYGPNGLYRAHGERLAGPGFAGGRPSGSASAGLAGRAFGDPGPAPRQTVAHAPGQASVQAASPTANQPAGGAARPSAGFGGAAFRPAGFAASGSLGGTDLSRWSGIGLPGREGAERIRTPELQLLIVDEDEGSRSTCSVVAGEMGYNVVGVATLAAAREILRHQMIDLLILDLKIQNGGDGSSLVEEVRNTNPLTAVVVTTANASVDSAVEAIRMGVGDYLMKPFVLEELTSVLERVGQSRQFDIESRLLRERLRTPNGMGKLIGRSPEMEKLYRILSKVAHSTHPVLILGESGTGKELVARSIHDNGPNAKKPFIPVDCSSLVSTLIESELFGYVKGAFTGANKTTEGLLAAADGGTVFLDEIGEIPLDLQAKLLRALQEKEVRPVGATHTVPISARVLAATNRDLATMVEQGRFRKDLYFRLNVVNLRIPPLRARPEDIPVLAMHFLEKMREQDRKPYEFAPEALRTMTLYHWPGNVRELEHAIERACAFSSGPVLQMMDMPSQLQDFLLQGRKKDAEAAAEASRATPHAAAQRDPAAEQIVSIAEMERKAILGTIDQLHGDKLMAAKLLGIGKTTLYRKLKEYGLGDETENGN